MTNVDVNYMFLLLHIFHKALKMTHTHTQRHKAVGEACTFQPIRNELCLSVILRMRIFDKFGWNVFFSGEERTVVVMRWSISILKIL